MKHYCEKTRKHGPPIVLAMGLAVALTLLLQVCGRCQLQPYAEFSAVQPGPSGTLAERIVRGEFICLPYSGNLFWLPDQKFTSFAGLKTESDNGHYNLVIPRDGSTDELVNATDTDFSILNNYYTPFSLDSEYRYSFNGDPVYAPAYETTRYSFAPYRVLSRNYYKAPVGKYDISCSYDDLGTVPEGCGGTVADAGGSFDYKLYIVDFTEQPRILPCNNTTVPISLTYSPSPLPNLSCLSVCVEWEGIDSCLYEDSACQSMITGSANTKTWSAATAPQNIYFKKPVGDINARQYVISLKAIVGGMTRILAVKKLQSEGGFAVTQVNGGTNTVGDLSGWWTGSYSLYPAVEWQDNSTPYDGEADDNPGPVSYTDVNRPLLYRTGGYFVIQNVKISHGDQVTYSPSDYTLNAVADNGMLDVSVSTFTDSYGVIEGSGFQGSMFNAVYCKDVRIRWKLIPINGGNTIEIGETKHKVYAIRGNATSVPIPYHTLVDLSCGAAKGLSTDSDVRNAVWEKVRSLHLIREDGGNALKYYGPESSEYVTNEPPLPTGWVYTTLGLIDHRDGWCGGWAEFMNDLMKVQGITSETVKLFPYSYSGVNDQNESVNIQGGWCSYPGGQSLVGIKQLPDAFQGHDSSASSQQFFNHSINKINNAYYDATSGNGPYASIADYASKNLQLVYVEGGVVKTITGDKLAGVEFENQRNQ
ncbi:MAG: hypothetical protein IJU51_05040 [Clostridia bacterium]|nr:hypothetical protein [Clostridia bacterium]